MIIDIGRKITINFAIFKILNSKHQISDGQTVSVEETELRPAAPSGKPTRNIILDDVCVFYFIS